MGVGAARRIIQEGKMTYSLGNGHLAFLKMKVVTPHKIYKYEIPQSVLNGLFHDGILNADFKLNKR